MRFGRRFGTVLTISLKKRTIRNIYKIFQYMVNANLKAVMRCFDCFFVHTLYHSLAFALVGSFPFPSIVIGERDGGGKGTLSSFI